MMFLQKQNRNRLLCLFIFLWGMVGATQANEQGLVATVAGTAPALTLSQALARVLRDSPELATYPYSLRAAEARTMQSALRPNPELSLELENIAGDNEFSGTDSAEITLALSQVIELGGKRRYRRNVARLGSEIVQQDYALARLDVLATAANRFLDVVSAQALLQLAEQAHNWSQKAKHAAQARFKAGSASRAELSQARIEALQATLAVSEAQSQLESARRILAAQWGAESPDFSEAKAMLFELSQTPEFTQLRARLDQSPQLQRYLTLDRLRQAELDLAIANGRQNLNVGLGLRRFEASGDQALTFGLSIPLGVSNSNEGNIAAARADLERLGSERQSSSILLYNKLYKLYQNLQQTRQRVKLLKTQALPEAEQALTQIEKGYRRGRFSYLELVETRRQRLSVERDVIDAAIGFHRALLALEQLTGESLTETPRSIMLQNVTEPYTQQDLQP